LTPSIQVTGTLSVSGSFVSASCAVSSSGISPLGPGARSVQIGYNANAANTQTIAIGDVANADADYGIAIGDAADCGGSTGIAIGQGANASGAGAVAIGSETTTSTNAASVAIGLDADATGEQAVAIGDAAQATANDAIAIGEDAAGSQTDTVAIGRATVASQPNAIAIGVAAKGQHQDTISMGHGANATVANSIAFGSGTLNQTTNTMTIGNASQAMDLNVTGNVSIKSGGLIGAGSETIGGTNGAISISTLISFIDDSGASAGTQTGFTLADGKSGQLKIVTTIVSGGAGLAGPPQLANTNVYVPNVIRWDAVGDTVILVFSGTKWAVAGSYGASIV